MPAEGQAGVAGIKVTDFYYVSLLRTSASRPLRLNLLVLEVFEVCVSLYRRRLRPEAEHDTCEVSESLGTDDPLTLDTDLGFIGK